MSAMQAEHRGRSVLKMEEAVREAFGSGSFSRVAVERGVLEKGKSVLLIEVSALSVVMQTWVLASWPLAVCFHCAAFPAAK